MSSASRFLRPFQEFTLKATDTPYEFGHAAGLVCLSTIALSRRWINRGASGIHPNLYLLLTAGSSADRKSTNVRHATDLIRDVEEDRLGPDDFTAEGLVSLMRSRKAGVTRNKITLPIEEFGHYLAQTKSYSSTNSAMLCKMYDGQTFERIRSGKKPMVVEKPRVNLFGGVAFGMLEKHADPAEWTTGFFARVIFVTPGHTKPPRNAVQPEFPRADYDQCRIKLTDLKNELDRTKGPMITTPEATEMYRTWVSKWDEGEPINEPAMIAQRERLLNSVWKIAMLYQIDTAPSEPIGVGAMDAAIRFAISAWTSFRIVYSVTGGDNFARMLNRVWTVVTKAGPEGISKSKLLRSNRLDAATLKGVIDVLVSMGAIYIAEKKSPAGPPVHICIVREPVPD